MTVDPEARRSRRPAAWSTARRPTAGRSSLVVHRPRYDDWSLPKGKLDSGESWEDAALREVEEEIGLRCRLGAGAPADLLPRQQGPRQGGALLADGADRRRRASSPTTRSTSCAGSPPGDAGGAAQLPARRELVREASRRARVNRDRFPGLSDGWARLDGPAGTQMVDGAIDAMADCMRSGRNANHGGAFAAARATDELRRRGARRGRRAARRRPARRRLRPEHDRPDDALRRRRRAHARSPATRWSARASTTTPTSRPWLIAAERAGATVRFAEPDRETLELPAAAVEAVLSERTRWVAVTAASNAVGTVPDLRGIVAAAHEAGARVYVDAVHAAPHRPLDVAALGCDALACSAYKWFGPHVGILCARARSCSRSSRPTSSAPRPTRCPTAGSSGTLPFESLAGVRAAADYVHRSAGSGPRARGARCSARARRPRGDRRRDPLRRRAATARRRSCSPSPGTPPTEVAAALAERESRGLARQLLRVGARALPRPAPTARVRAGFVHYNDDEDAERLLDGVRALAEAG